MTHGGIGGTGDHLTEGDGGHIFQRQSIDGILKSNTVDGPASCASHDLIASSQGETINLEDINKEQREKADNSVCMNKIEEKN